MLRALTTYAWAIVFVVGAALGWRAGTVNTEHRYQQAAADAQAQAREEERKDRAEKAQAQAEIDRTESTREVDVQYVDREVVKYVTKFVDRGCPVLPERVCIYNRALGLPCDVPPAPSP